MGGSGPSGTWMRNGTSASTWRAQQRQVEALAPNFKKCASASPVSITRTMSMLTSARQAGHATNSVAEVEGISNEVMSDRERGWRKGGLSGLDVLPPGQGRAVGVDVVGLMPVGRDALFSVFGSRFLIRWIIINDVTEAPAPAR